MCETMDACCDACRRLKGAMRIACPFPTPPPPPLARFAASESLATAASHLASDMGSGDGIFGTTPASAHARAGMLTA